MGLDTYFMIIYRGLTVVAFILLGDKPDCLWNEGFNLTDGWLRIPLLNFNGNCE
jgi:hypothetical protein